MRNFIFLSLLLSSVASGNATDKVIYYSGVEIRTSLIGGEQIVENLLLEKALLPGQGVIREIACVKSGKNPAETHPVYMEVKDGKITRISDKPDYNSEILKGTGTLEGQAWDWNYLVFSMTYKMPGGTTRIEDENWASGKHLVAIKEIYWQDLKGSPETKVGLITAKVQEIDEATYLRKLQEMGCP